MAAKKRSLLQDQKRYGGATSAVSRCHWNLKHCYAAGTLYIVIEILSSIFSAFAVSATERAVCESRYLLLFVQQPKVPIKRMPGGATKREYLAYAIAVGRA